MLENILISVTGMKCGGCEANVTSKLSALSGVSSVVANHKTSTVAVEFDDAQIDLDTVSKVITDAGFIVN